MNDKSRVKISKFLSLVLRHKPEAAGVSLDENGWVAIDELLAGARRVGKKIAKEVLLEVVETNPKQRFAISTDGLKIRASQGHSVEVDLGYEPAKPPPRLFHGTVEASLGVIRETGLQRMKRHDVHLSTDCETATVVGSRRGHPVILSIRADEMATAGFSFSVSANGVWLTREVPPEFIDFPLPVSAPSPKAPKGPKGPKAVG